MNLNNKLICLFMLIPAFTGGGWPNLTFTICSAFQSKWSVNQYVVVDELHSTTVSMCSLCSFFLTIIFYFSWNSSTLWRKKQSISYRVGAGGWINKWHVVNEIGLANVISGGGRTNRGGGNKGKQFEGSSPFTCISTWSCLINSMKPCISGMSIYRWDEVVRKDRFQLHPTEAQKWHTRMAIVQITCQHTFHSYIHLAYWKKYLCALILMHFTQQEIEQNTKTHCKHPVRSGVVRYVFQSGNCPGWLGKELPAIVDNYCSFGA